jgi:urease accessory protein
MAPAVIGAPMGLLLLADSRLPAGGHSHSGGVEALVDRKLLASADDLAAFLDARVRTTAAVPAAAAAAGCALATGRQGSHHQDTGCPDGGFADTAEGWARWDAAVSARMPAAALREASRAQGAALLRTAGAAWPTAALAALGELRRPHHAVVLGAAAAAAGAAPRQAAALAVHHLIGGACTAAVRLLGLDPLAVGALAAVAGREAETVVAEATEAALAAVTTNDPALLPTDGNPLADVLAQLHHRSEATLFAS